MNRYLLIVLFLVIVVSPSIGQQKRALEPADYAIWNQINRQLISNDGKWVAYVAEPGEGAGNSTLSLYDGTTDKTQTMERADAPRFSADNRFLIYTLHPDKESVKEMRRNGKKKKDLPKDTMVVMKLADLSSIKVPGASNVQVPRKWGDWVFFKLENEIKKDENAKAEKRTDLVAHQLSTGDQAILAAAGDYVLAMDNASAAAVSEGFEEEIEPGIFYLDANTKEWAAVHEQKGEYEQLSIDRQGSQVAFLADFDTTESRIDYFDLYQWNKGATAPEKVADRTDAFLPEGWLISKNGSLTFSKNGQRLSFGIAPPPVLEDTTLLPEEKVSVEVWNYQDKLLYTEQEVRANREKRRTYACVWLKDSKKVVQLGSEEVPQIRPSVEGNGKYALGLDPRPYQMQSSWESNSRTDVYLVEVATGEKKRIAEALSGRPDFSPDGNFVYWFNSIDTAWFAYQIDKNKTVQLTDNSKVAFYNELHDSPSLPRSYGLAGWTKDDDFMLIYDRYDIWLVDPSKELAHNNLTNGRAQKRVSRYVWLDQDERSIQEVEPMLLSFTDEDTRASGYYWFNIHTGVKNVVQEGDYSYSRRPVKAKDANHWMFTKESYQDFPNISYSRNGLTNPKQISDVNPQQKDYNWGSIEIVSWTSTDGQKLEGMLVKPENFDPNKKYPMIVNFYERSSQGLHRHRTPTAGRSTINYPYYASRGYLIFNPDVPYNIGYPGESAYNAVLSGTLSLIDRGFVDKDNIGLQGHSWGGYQIAHIITKTDLFKCVESGAPVVNMFSAYGGIRWASGKSRMFQYEETQSRIDGTIWDKPLRYLENSPLFFLDKVNTPVLILHNDNDGAVPWYQGIEFFVGMRRLGKPAWMLNYNDEPHWPLKLQNRQDFQLRMSQFFDYYLQGAPMPRWMAEGVPAVEKGLDQRLELMDKN